MKLLALALCALLTFACPVQAATLQATPATIAATLKAAQPGDVVVLTGEFPGLPLSGLSFTPAITLDASAATITKFTYAKPVNGVTIRGGKWREGLRIDGGERIKVQGATFVGPFGASTFAALHLNWVKDVEVSGSEVAGVITGMILTGVDGFAITENFLHELRSDGIDLAGARNGVVRGNVIVSPRPLDGDHPDGVQLLQAGATWPVENIVIDGNVIAGRMQGIFGGNGPYRNITIRGNAISAGYVNGIGIGDVTGLVLEDNEVSTLPGSPWQSLIGSPPAATTYLGWNVARAYKGRPELVLSRPPSTALTATQLSELSDLRARLAAAVSALTK